MEQDSIEPGGSDWDAHKAVSARVRLVMKLTFLRCSLVRARPRRGSSLSGPAGLTEKISRGGEGVERVAVGIQLRWKVTGGRDARAEKNRTPQGSPHV